MIAIHRPNGPRPSPLRVPAIEGKGHEGPNVFRWRNSWWLITDHWDRLGVFRSPDAEHWPRQPGNVLKEPGHRSDDGVKGGHADSRMGTRNS